MPEITPTGASMLPRVPQTCGRSFRAVRPGPATLLPPPHLCFLHFSPCQLGGLPAPLRALYALQQPALGLPQRGPCRAVRAAAGWQAAVGGWRRPSAHSQAALKPIGDLIEHSTRDSAAPLTAPLGCAAAAAAARAPRLLGLAGSRRAGRACSRASCAAGARGPRSCIALVGRGNTGTSLLSTDPVQCALLAGRLMGKQGN